MSEVYQSKNPKYAGHTAGPWVMVDSWNDFTVQKWNGDDIVFQDGPHGTPNIKYHDAALIADAPFLACEVERLTKRVAELEDASNPILDPARVLLTAIGILASEKEFRASASISDAMFRCGLEAKSPYPLKGASDGE